MVVVRQPEQSFPSERAPPAQSPRATHPAPAAPSSQAPSARRIAPTPTSGGFPRVNPAEMALAQAGMLLLLVYDSGEVLSADLQQRCNVSAGSR